MSDKKETKAILSKILEILTKFQIKEDLQELTVDGDEAIKNMKANADYGVKKIQSSFDRIHDKLFTFNNMLIAAFLGLSKFPNDNPIFELWAAILPIINLIYFMFLEKMQMEIYRYLAKTMQWDIDSGPEKYGKMINSQNLRSLLAIFTTFGLFLFLVIKILIY